MSGCSDAESFDQPILFCPGCRRRGCFIGLHGDINDVSQIRLRDAMGAEPADDMTYVFRCRVPPTLAPSQPHAKCCCYPRLTAKVLTRMSCGR
jgi:hypothetical protein